jgi:hypothetical protein
MNEWKELDKNNIPSDILVDGKYEFGRHIYEPYGGEIEKIPSAKTAIWALSDSSTICYRKKAIEPKTFEADLRNVSCFQSTTNKAILTEVRFYVDGHMGDIVNSSFTITVNPRKHSK